MIKDAAETKVLARESRAQAAARLLGCFLFVSAGVGGARIIPSQSTTLLAAATFFAVLSVRYSWSSARPGYLLISDQGLEQDLGWRRAMLRWDQISGVVLYEAPLGFTAVLINRGERSRPTRLFGWNIPPTELKRIIDRLRRKSGHHPS